jgi:hypothetical protein
LSDQSMMVALIHWRIKPEPEQVDAFLDHWKHINKIGDRTGLIGEFLSDSFPMVDFPQTTWHLDSESLGDFKSYVTVGLWRDADAFKDQIAKYFNDSKPMEPFEKYRRRRVIFRPVEWRIGVAGMPTADSDGVE